MTILDGAVKQLQFPTIHWNKAPASPHQNMQFPMHPLPLAPTGFHWKCVGFVPVFYPVCCATMKAVGRGECRWRACCDLAERNVRLILQGKVNERRAVELAEDLWQYCPTAAMYAQWLLDARDELPPIGHSDRRQKLRERRRAMQAGASPPTTR